MRDGDNYDKICRTTGPWTCNGAQDILLGSGRVRGFPSYVFFASHLVLCSLKIMQGGRIRAS